jgi:hypothetical protein
MHSFCFENCPQHNNVPMYRCIFTHSKPCMNLVLNLTWPTCSVSRGDTCWVHPSQLHSIIPASWLVIAFQFSARLKPLNLHGRASRERAPPSPTTGEAPLERERTSCNMFFFI